MSISGRLGIGRRFRSLAMGGCVRFFCLVRALQQPRLINVAVEDLPPGADTTGVSAEPKSLLVRIDQLSKSITRNTEHKTGDIFDQNAQKNTLLVAEFGRRIGIRWRRSIRKRGSTMFTSTLLVRVGRTPLLVLVLVASVLSGCKSKQEQALDQAKKQAIATGQPQQVVSVDKNGTTTTTTVQPTASGQANPVITTTVTPPATGVPHPAQSEPIVSPANVSIPAGTTLTIRIDQQISVKTSRAGDTFTGELVEPVLGVNSSLLLPKGTVVGGVVVVAHRRGHFKGRSLLELRLTSLTLDGMQYPLTTKDLARGKKGKGKRSTALIAGGSGLGMLVGGVASGGVGLVIGGLVGGGAGTAVAGLTGNGDIQIPAESIVHFNLAEDLLVLPAQ